MTTTAEFAPDVDAASRPGEVFLTRRRLRYALIAGAALWATWIVSVLFGPGHLDLAGQAVGNDFTQFYAAGLTARTGDTADLYNLDVQFPLQRKIIGPGTEGFPAFLTPPFHVWIYAPLSVLPYEVAFAVWAVAGIVLLYCALKLIGVEPRRTMPYALSFFPVFAAVSFGQNTLLSMAILAGTYALWRSRRLVLAGLVLSLILYKPQLALGMCVLWCLEWRRDFRALAGFAAGGSVLAAFSFLVMPEASEGYIVFSRDVLPRLMTFSNPSVWHMHTLRAFFELLLGVGTAANVLAAVASLAILAGFVPFWRAYRSQPAILFAGAVLLTVLITPHALVYEWALLVIPAALLWKERPQDRQFLAKAYAWVYIAIWFAGPITRLELILTGRAVQMSVPVLIAAAVFGWRRVVGEPRPRVLPTRRPQGGARAFSPASGS